MLEYKDDCLNSCIRILAVGFTITSSICTSIILNIMFWPSEDFTEQMESLPLTGKDVFNYKFDESLLKGGHFFRGPNKIHHSTSTPQKFPFQPTPVPTDSSYQRSLEKEISSLLEKKTVLPERRKLPVLPWSIPGFSSTFLPGTEEDRQLVSKYKSSAIQCVHSLKTFFRGW